MTTLTVIAAASDGDSPTAAEVRGVLEQWSTYGFLREFIWVTASPNAPTARWVRDGVSDDSFDLGELFTNYRGDVRLVVLSVAAGPEASFDEEVDLGRAVEDIFRQHFQSDRIAAAMQVIAPFALGERLPASRVFPAFLWAPEDRSGVDYPSTLTEERFPAHVAHGVATLAGLWTFGDLGSASMEVTVADEPRVLEGSVRLARAFVRLLVFPEIRHDLLADLPVEGDVVVRPGQQYERVELSGQFDAMADHFLEQHAQCLGRSVTNDLELPEDGQPPKMALLEALRARLEFLVRFITELPDATIDRLSEKTYAWLAAKASGGLPIYSWDEAHGIGPERGFVEAPLESIEAAAIDDGPFGAMWLDLQRAVFSLLDGTAYDWGIALPRRGAGHVVLATSRSSIVGIEATQPEVDAAAPTDDLEVTASGPAEVADGPGGSAALDPSFLGAVAAHLAKRQETFTEVLDELAAQLVAVEEAIREELAGDEDEPQLTTWRQKLRRAFARDDAHDERPSSIRRRMVRAIRRRSILGGVFGTIATVLIGVLLSPIGAIVSAINVLIGTAISIYGRAWEAHVAEGRSIAAHQGRVAKHINIQTRIRFLKGDLLRLERRSVELDTWSAILRHAALHPYPAPSVTFEDGVPPAWSRPLAVMVGVADVDPATVSRLRRSFEESIFVEGWIATRFDATKRAFLTHRGYEGGVSLEGDSSSDPESMLRQFATAFMAESGEFDASQDLVDRATRFLKEENLADVAPTERPTDDGAPRPADPQPSETFLTELATTPGKFLEAEFAKPSTQREDATVDEANVQIFGARDLDGIRFPSPKAAWTVPYIASGVLHYSHELDPGERIKGPGSAT